MKLPVPTFLRHPDGRDVFRADETHRPLGRKVARAPPQRGADGLGGQASALRPRCKHPAHFRDSFDGWLEVPLEVSESNLADEAAGVFLLQHPEAETEHRPVADVA